MPAAEIVDLDLDPRDARRRRRRRWLRIGVPIVGFATLVLAIAAIALFAYTSNRRDALALSRDLLDALERRIDAQVEAYLAPAASMAMLARGLLANEAPGERRRGLAEPVGIEVLKTTPQLANLYLADPNGDFLMLRRAPDGAIDTKRIDGSAVARRVVWTRRNPAGETIRLEEDPSDTYDARTRSWYQAASKGDGLVWTEAYVFFSDRKPGITAALPMRAPDGALAAVLGVDIDLQSLSTFLAGLEIGKHGRAMIVDQAGKLVAYPELPRMLRQQGDEITTARLDQLDDPVLNQAYDRWQVSGHGRRSFKIGGARWIAAASPIDAVVGRGWTLLIVVPEDDFVGFLADNGRTALAMSAGIVAIAALLAMLLARQGLRADRQAILVLERERALKAQSGAFAELAASAHMFDRDDDAAPRRVAEIVARAVEARRVSLWRFAAGGDVLACVDCYDRATGGHTGGTELPRAELPQAFAWLDAGQELEVADAAADPRTAELHRLYLHPVGCDALLSVPIKDDTRILGAVWIEDEAMPIGDRMSFARAVAAMLALRFAGVQAPAAAVAPEARQRARAGRAVADTEALRSAAFGDRGEALMRRFAARGGTLAAEVFPDTTVLAIRFTDHLTLAERPRDGEASGMLDRMARALEAIATRQGIGYLKILGDQVVAAEGLGGEGDHAELLAEMALEIQEGGARLFAQNDRRVAFRIGLDTGGVIGSAVGEGHHTYNLWGEAVRTASAMAESGPAGAIHVSESTYRRLRDRYLFRPRGTFYLDRVGEMSTYLLVGRL